MFANFGTEQEEREVRLARQNKEHLDALRAQLEADRLRKRAERRGERHTIAHPSHVPYPTTPRRHVPAVASV